MIRVGDFLRDQAIRRMAEAPQRPAVSVVLPTYSRRECGLLERAIRSVLGQTFGDLELIVVDDGSNDGSADLIQSLQAEDARLVHIRHEANCGLPALRVNEGIELARGERLAFQFDDDAWRPRALEALVDASRRNSGAVVAGRAQFRSDGRGRWTLPPGRVDAVCLHEGNCLANNAVLVPRELVARHGMYDCHVGMRRLCDWDLWLRYVAHAEFVTVDEVVSDVRESNAGAIGVTVPWDPSLFRTLQAIPRDHLLTPERWRDYPVDGLSVGGAELARDARRRLYEDHVVPFYLRTRHLFPGIEGFPPTLPGPRRSVLLTKGSYDVSNDVALNHYDAVTSERGTYKAHFEPLAQVGRGWTRDNDAVLLVRTVEDEARDVLDEALERGAPAGLHLDDDLLSFHEFGDAFRYLAPGTPCHDNLRDLLSRADAVWVTNDVIRDSVRPFNPRTLPHNNAIPEAALPKTFRTRDPGRPLRVGYVGSGYRREEFEGLWEGLRRFAEERRDRVEFEFWGLDVSSLPRLACPVRERPFTFSYFLYLERLREAGFDVLLVPLLDRPRPRLAKSLVKYYEAAVAGALGIFSDVLPYAPLPAGVTCLKAGPSAADWYQALCGAAEMEPARFDLMRQRALAHVREEYTERAQIHRHEAAWRATEFHARTRAARHADGRPRVAYVLHSASFAGAELQLWRRLRIARDYGVEPIAVLPRVLEENDSARQLVARLADERLASVFVDYTCYDQPAVPGGATLDLQREDARRFLESTRPALVHSATFVPAFGLACAETGVPHVASLYAVDDDVGWTSAVAPRGHAQVVQSDSLRYARRWSELLGTEKACAREVVPAAVFALGRERCLAGLGRPPTAPSAPLRLVVSGTLQERKQQWEAIEAVGLALREGLEIRLDLYGYTQFFPEYVARCRQRITRLGLEDHVALRGFSEDPLEILRAADVVMSVSTFESFPSAIKEAMAAGVLVVATPVGGIPELVVDGVSGILCRDTSVEALAEGIRRAARLTPADRERIVEQARRVARSEFHPDRAASDLFSVYVRAIDTARGERPVRASSPANATLARPSTGRVERPSGRPASHILIGRGITYRLQIARPRWEGLDVLLGTHAGRPGGTLQLSVRGAGGRLVLETSADLSEVRDNEWVRFRFAPVEDASAQAFTLEFRVRGARRGVRLSLYEANPPESRVRRLLRRAGLALPGNSLFCRTWHAEAS